METKLGMESYSLEVKSRIVAVMIHHIVSGKGSWKDLKDMIIQTVHALEFNDHSISLKLSAMEWTDFIDTSVQDIMDKLGLKYL